jgi:hypothetical protein
MGIPARIPTVSKVTLIRVVHVIGAGVVSDPVREVSDYYTEDGEHFMRDDPCAATTPTGEDA